MLYKRVEKSVAEHFNQSGHSMDDLTIMCIEKIRKAMLSCATLAR